jgi:hypothetical protein
MFAAATKSSVGSNPIEFVNGFTGSTLVSGVSSVTFSGHQIGDLLIATGGGQRSTDPTFTAGWTKITSFFSTNLTRVGIIVYKFATSTANETVTFTSTGSSSAAYSAGHIYRNVVAIGNSVARTNISVAEGDTTVPLLDLTLQKTNSTSWVYASSYIPQLASATDMTENNGQLYLASLSSNFTARTANTDGSSLVNISGVVELLNM